MTILPIVLGIVGHGVFRAVLIYMRAVPKVSFE